MLQGDLSIVDQREAKPQVAGLFPEFNLTVLLLPRPASHKLARESLLAASSLQALPFPRAHALELQFTRTRARESTCSLPLAARHLQANLLSSTRKQKQRIVATIVSICQVTGCV